MTECVKTAEVQTRFSDLAVSRSQNNRFDRSLFDKLLVEKMDKGQLITNTRVFEPFLLFYRINSHKNFNLDFIQPTTQIKDYLMKRVENMGKGSPIIAVKQDGQIKGLAFVLQYNSDIAPLTWQDMTGKGKFNNDDMKNGSLLVCPQFLSVDDETVRVKLMEGLLEYALTRYPDHATEFKVWAMKDDKEQCSFHHYYAYLEKNVTDAKGLYHLDVDKPAMKAPEMKVFDYTPILNLISEPVPEPEHDTGHVRIN